VPQDRQEGFHMYNISGPLVISVTVVVTGISDVVGIVVIVHCYDRHRILILGIATAQYNNLGIMDADLLSLRVTRV
jgi:hypothetical protein